MTVNTSVLLLLTSSGLGDGEIDLAEKLMISYLRVLADSGTAPAKIICMNSGIFLTTEGSAVLETMKKFESAGTEILSFGTCLDYYNRKDKLIVGKPGTMVDTVQAMLTHDRVLRP